MDLMDALLSSDYEDEEEELAADSASPVPPEAKEQSSEEAWDNLLEDIAFEEDPEEEPESRNVVQNLLGRFRKSDADAALADGDADSAARPKRAGFLAGFSRGQKIILGILLLAVGCVYVGLVTVVVTSMRQPQAAPLPSATLEVIVPNGTRPVGSAVAITATAEITTTESREPVGTPTPTPAEPTPSPTPTVPAPLTQYDRDLNVAPDDVDLRLNRGAVYLEAQAYIAAMQDFEHAISIEKERAEAYNGLGQAFLYLGRWGEAEIVFSTAISFDERLPQPHFNLAMLYYYRARYAEAAREFDWAAELNPDFVEAECWLAIAAARSDDPEEALAAASRAYSLTQELPLVYIARSWAWRVQDPPDVDSAQGDLLYAQSLEPYGFEVLNALARFYAEYRLERLSEAEQLAQYAINWGNTSVDRARGLHTLGRIYLQLDRKEDARKVLSQAAALTMADDRIGMPELAADLEKTFAP